MEMRCTACQNGPLVSWRTPGVPESRKHAAHGLCRLCYKRFRRRAQPRTTWRNEDLRAEVTFLLGQGSSLVAIADQLGMRPASIARAFQRAGQPFASRSRG
jgi:hypothetical protein